ncbi:MAG TPA: PfkB family carbohydrate kinase [Chloroflexota bacterium]|nr:PfkB family carbohydrate kinase [Chloroflexota bacterium]
MQDESRFAEIVVVGATCFDVKATPLAPMQPGISNPARIRLCPGGAGRNIAENLARLGASVALLSAVGNDVTGKGLLQWTAMAGVDVSRVINSFDQSTGAFLAIFDENNHQGYVLDDVVQLRLATPDYVQSQRDLIAGSKLVWLDGNVDSETVASVLLLAGELNVPVGLDPASVRRAYALRPYLSEFSVVTANRAETEAFLDLTINQVEDALEAARKMVGLGVGAAVITLAEDGLVYATTEEFGRIPAPQCDIVDWAGAGDAVAAVVAYCLVNQLPVDEAARLCAAAASLTLQSPDSVNPEMSLEQLYSHLVV